MDNVAVSRRNYSSKKGNKENAQPTHGSKSLLKKDVPKTKTTSVTPFKIKSNEKEATLTKDGAHKVKQSKMKLTSEETVKKARTVQKDGKGGGAKPQTYSQAFLTDQAVKHRKLVAEAPKPPATVSSSKSAPGMYKGKIVQSKIGSIWKSSATVGEAGPKPTAKPLAPKTESQRFGNLTSRPKSVSDMPGCGMQKPKSAPARSKSVSDGPAPVSKPAASSRPTAGFCSALAPARTIPVTLKGPSSRSTTTAPKGRGIENSKPKIPTEKKVSKPPVSSTLSQYRLNTQTAEERRAKLADWQASKGKTLKRPSTTTAAPPKTRTAMKPGNCLESQPHPCVAAQPSVQCDPEPLLDDQRSDTAAQCADTQEAERMTHNSSQLIMNTTLDLLEHSDVDLPVDPQTRVDDIVINLCEVLEAMVTPSQCEDEPPQMKDKCRDAEMVDNKPKDECEELSNVVPEDGVEEMEDEAGRNDDLKVEKDVEEDDNNDDKSVIKNTPQMEEASVVKYSVKTTPFLQSVKRTIEGEASTRQSRRKSNIKDLKFLTPVRRSCRIQRQSSHLPAMLVDHDPCVSSLAELVKLDDDANAYIYRRNPALLDDLPDQERP
ncbi:hypothetical protein LDENG_00052390 [Lucifuga dentata]|nr:hypothetical protein LDENG_00052390 [Lucifuga dentata]